MRGIMRLSSIRIYGFRSLADVGPIPIRQPTILAGHNDSGKTACLDAVAFLLGWYQVHDEDRTFERQTDVMTSLGQAGDGVPDSIGSARVPFTSVEGIFTLSVREQEELGLPQDVRIRRISPISGASALEIEAVVSVDPELRNLEARTVAELKEIAAQRSVEVASSAVRKQSWIDALKDYAAGLPTSAGWTPASAAVRDAMPRFLRFGEPDSAELAVKTALSSRYKLHLEDPDLRGQVQSLEDELRKRVRHDAEGLIAHVKIRCPDLVVVDVDPDISFTGGLRATRLRLARTDGEEISIDASGAGRARRVSLAIWEWTSEILKTDAANGSEPGPESRDVVIVYDEPDTHLDYLQQRRVMKLIREQCDVPGVSMLIATHSMNLIDGAATDDIVHFTLVNQRTQAERLLDDLDDSANAAYLADIAAALGLGNTVLLHERCFVGVEGPTEQQAFPILFRLAQGKSLQSAGIVVVGCNNNEGALMFAGYLAKTGRQVALVVDADSRKNSRYFSDERLARAGLDPQRHVYLVGDPDKELEYVFTDAQWAGVANAIWPRNDGLPWNVEDIQAIRAKPKFSDELCQMFKIASDSGPSRKTAMVYELVRRLRKSDEVPKELADIFQKLEQLAALDA